MFLVEKFAKVMTSFWKILYFKWKNCRNMDSSRKFFKFLPMYLRVYFAHRHYWRSFWNFRSNQSLQKWKWAKNLHVARSMHRNRKYFPAISWCANLPFFNQNFIVLKDWRNVICFQVSVIKIFIFVKFSARDLFTFTWIFNKWRKRVPTVLEPFKYGSLIGV